MSMDRSEKMRGKAIKAGMMTALVAFGTFGLAAPSQAIFGLDNPLGGAATGGLIGAIAGGGKGAVIGALSGAVVGGIVEDSKKKSGQ